MCGFCCIVVVFDGDVGKGWFGGVVVMWVYFKCYGVIGVEFGDVEGVGVDGGKVLLGVF